MTNEKSVKEEFGNPPYVFCPEETIAAQTNWRDSYLALKKACDEAEPVGYRYVDHNGHWCFNEMKFGDIAEPVYSHPATVIVSEQKPEGYLVTTLDGLKMLTKTPVILSGHTSEPLFTSPPNTAEIEQRVTEAIAKMIQGWSCTNGPSIAEAIRSGKWREYL